MSLLRSVVAAVVLLVSVTAIVSPASAATVIAPGGFEVTQTGPNLVVRGTDGPDIANINQLVDGSVTVNGMAFPGVTGRLEIYMGDGQDRIAINDLDEGFEPSSSIPSLRSLLISTGPGRFTSRIDELSVDNSLTVVGSPQSTLMRLSYVDVGADLRFFLDGTDGRDDAVNLYSVDVGGTFVFRQAAGLGRVNATLLTAAKTRIFTGKDRDILFLNDSELGDTRISTSDGDDRVEIIEPAGAAPIVIRTGFGTDRVNVLEPGNGAIASRPYSLDINLGSGPADASLIGVLPNSGDRFIGGVGPDDVIRFCGPFGSETGGAFVNAFETVKSSMSACTPN